MKCVLIDEGQSALMDLARLCSPRVESLGSNAAVFDASGLSRVLGAPRDIAGEVQRLAVERGVRARIAIAPTTTAAWLLAQHRVGITVIESKVAEALAPLPVSLLLTVPGLADLAVDVRRQRVARGPNFRAAPSPMRRDNTGFVRVQAQILAIFERWAIRTLGDVAGLPRAELRARFGDVGARLHEASLGEDRLPLTPGAEPRRFVERLALDWPVDGLEPLSFVIARLCDTLSKQLEDADRGAVSVTTRLALVSKAGVERTLHLPAPMRDARVLRTLIQLDLEAHPLQGVTDEATGLATSGVDAVEIEVEVSPGRITQGALFIRSIPTPETLSTLIARLGALMGHDRVGSPMLTDSHDERNNFIQAPMNVLQERTNTLRQSTNALQQSTNSLRERTNALALRRVRTVPAIRKPSAKAAAGPWRSSGYWWKDGAAWDRDTWDLQMASGELQRVSFNRRSKNWELEGTYD
jgi:protein ImuB